MKNVSQFSSKSRILCFSGCTLIAAFPLRPRYSFVLPQLYPAFLSHHGSCQCGHEGWCHRRRTRLPTSRWCKILGLSQVPWNGGRQNPDEDAWANPGNSPSIYLHNHPWIRLDSHCHLGSAPDQHWLDLGEWRHSRHVLGFPLCFDRLGTGVLESFRDGIHVSHTLFAEYVGRCSRIRPSPVNGGTTIPVYVLLADVYSSKSPHGNLCV